MTRYEMRTYTLHAGKMADAEVKLLTASRWGPHP